MIVVTHSCGDCGFAGRDPDFKYHHRREWHRLVMLVGLHAALEYHVADILPDARRAISIFREGANP